MLLDASRLDLSRRQSATMVGERADEARVCLAGPTTGLSHSARFLPSTSATPTAGAPIAVSVAVSTQRHQDAKERTGRVRRALHSRNLDV